MKPILQALLVADHVYRDAATGKHIICGTFNGFYYKRSEPTERTIEVRGEKKQVKHIPDVRTPGNPSVYVSLTEVRGRMHFVLRYVNLTLDKPLFQTTFDINCEDPLATVELAIPIPQLPQVEGVHALELLCGDEPIGSHRIMVRDMTENEDSHGNEN